MAGVSRANLLI